MKWWRARRTAGVEVEIGRIYTASRTDRPHLIAYGETEAEARANLEVLIRGLAKVGEMAREIDGLTTRRYR